MNWRGKISWFIHQKIVGRLYAMQFYVTALNTFDGGPSGTFGIEDAKGATIALLTQAQPLFKRRLPFGLMSRAQALAKSFILATTFWFAHAKNLECEMEKQKRQKQMFVAFLLKKKVLIPLSLLYSKQDADFLRTSFGLETLQDLILYAKEHKDFPGRHFLWQMNHWIMVYELGLEKLFIPYVTIE
jgi:hypothetical protein